MHQRILLTVANQHPKVLLTAGQCGDFNFVLSFEISRWSGFDFYKRLTDGKTKRRTNKHLTLYISLAVGELGDSKFLLRFEID